MNKKIQQMLRNPKFVKIGIVVLIIAITIIISLLPEISMASSG